MARPKLGDNFESIPSGIVRVLDRPTSSSKQLYEKVDLLASLVAELYEEAHRIDPKTKKVTRSVPRGWKGTAIEWSVRRARVGRAAARAEMTVEKWLAYCEKLKWDDTTKIPPKLLAKLDLPPPGYRNVTQNPKPKRGKAKVGRIPTGPSGTARARAKKRTKKKTRRGKIVQ